MENEHGDVVYRHRFGSTHWEYNYDTHRGLHVYTATHGPLKLYVDVESSPTDNTALRAVWSVTGLTGHKFIGTRESLTGAFESACANAMNVTLEVMRGGELWLDSESE